MLKAFFPKFMQVQAGLHGYYSGTVYVLETLTKAFHFHHIIIKWNCGFIILSIENGKLHLRTLNT